MSGPDPILSELEHNKERDTIVKIPNQLVINVKKKNKKIHQYIESNEV